MPGILQDEDSVLSLDSSVLAFIKYMEGSLMAFLELADGSAWIHINGTYNSIWSYFRFPTQSTPIIFIKSENSDDH